ncbi:unnamed protein product [Brassicogethes aeneus]|uniref:Uncharacterized protein n=1 Tax=Brassicogethes aeneus TaxID=1431903 RepID=A0A9P0AU70_BRAAE|nr:unnamed protein product [Brassicogethes aeneus]
MTSWVQFENDCYICYMRPGLLLAGGVFAMSKFYCSHKNNVTFAYFELFWYHHLIALMYTFPFYVITVILVFSVGDEMEDKIRLTMRLFLYVSFVLMDVSNHFYQRLQVNMMNTLLFLLANRRLYGVKMWFSDKSSMLTSFTTFMFTSIYIVITLVGASYAVDQKLNYFQSFIKYSAFLSAVCNQQIEQCLENYRSNGNFECGSYFYSLPLEDQLKRLHRLYLQILHLYQLSLGVLANVQITLIPIVLIVYLIGYSILYIFNSKQEDTQTTGAFVSVVIISMCLIDVFGMTIPATMTANIGDDIISYLFRYPTAILRPHEAAQVELLIFTLTALKPKLVASRVINVGVSLIASISGAVVTYILVALQLHQAFIKNFKNIEAARN